ncbi:hypothetical protein ACI79P_19095 [Blastococcus sp. SYSU DS0510]
MRTGRRRPLEGAGEEPVRPGRHAEPEEADSLAWLGFPLQRG